MENKNGRVQVVGLREVQVDSAEKAISIWQQGISNRRATATALNNSSSRSHCVTRITLVRKGQGESEGIKLAPHLCPVFLEC